MSAVDFEETRPYEEDDRAYDRGRDSPRGGDARGGDSRARSASPDGRDRGDSRQAASKEDDENARNPGSNLFVTGIHPRLTEEDVSHLFEKFGEVEKANIMRDPHSGDSRGFGFVKMVTPEQADAAREGLHGVVHEGRTLSIEKARRARPRTPTPGKYYGPPKRDGGRLPSRGGRFDDRRGGGGYGRRDEYYGGGYRGSGGSRYGGDRDRYDDQYGSGSGSDRRYRDRGDYGRPERGADRGADRSDRYRDDRYNGGGRDDRRGGGGGGGGYGGGREERGGYGDAAPPRESREAYGGSRGYDDRGDYH